MARMPRVVVAGVPHHVTQRGNGRQVILARDSDRTAYLELLRQYSALHGLSLLGYCLMSNHVHLIANPHSVQAFGANAQIHSRTLRRLLERAEVRFRPRMARSVLLVPFG